MADSGSLSRQSYREQLGNQRAGAYVEWTPDGESRWLAWLGAFVIGGLAADKTNAWCAVLHAVGDDG